MALHNASLKAQTDAGTKPSGSRIEIDCFAPPDPKHELVESDKCPCGIARAFSGELEIKLTGWAVPVFSGTLAGTFLEELHATQ